MSNRSELSEQKGLTQVRLSIELEINQETVRYGKNATQQVDIYYNFAGMLQEK